MWIKKYKIFYRPYFWLVIVGIFLLTCIYFYSRHYLILGGEGNYFLNIPEINSLYRYSWLEFLRGTGYFNPQLNFSFIIFDFLKLLQKIDLKFANVISIFGVYYLPFISMFFLLKNIFKVNLLFSVLLSVFYIINPFCTYYLQQFMFWNESILYILPISFILINRFFYKSKELFIFIGLTSFIFSYGFSNIPTFGVVLISLLVILIINSAILNNKFDYKRIFVNFVLILTSFFLINFWWLQNFIFNFRKFMKINPINFAIALQEGDKTINILYKIFSLSWLIPDSIEHGFLSYFFNLPTVKPFLLLPFIFIILSLIKFYKKFRTILYFISFILVTIFLTAGGLEPLGKIYIYMMKYLPFFFIFKSPQEKFGVLLIFLITITIGFLYTLEHKKRITYILLFYLLICSIPFLTGNFIVEREFEDNKYESRKFILKKEYIDTINNINNDKNLYRILSLPGSLNYQVALSIEDNRYYTGNDPIMYALNKPFITSYEIVIDNDKNDFLFSKIFDKGWENALPYYNIKKIIVNKDMYPWYRFVNNININDLEKALDAKFKYEKNKNIIIYDVNNFLPKIYTANKIKVLKYSETFFDFIRNDYSAPDNNLQAIFLENQLNGSQINFLKKYAEIEKNISPKITFQKINSTKYVIKVEEAKTPFFLIFSESFSPEWKAYIESKDVNFNKILFDYKSIGVKEAEHEMKMKINDFYYLFKKSVNENNHFLVDNYANAWYINPGDTGKGNYTITLMYKPQFYAYFGILISILTLLSHTSCGILFFIKKSNILKRIGKISCKNK